MLGVISVCVMLITMSITTSVRSEIVYARPDQEPNSTYLWAGEVVTTSVPVADAIATARSAKGSRPLEIRLLRRADTHETTYSLNLGSTELAIRWDGSETTRLTLRGQVDRSGPVPRALTTIVGPKSLRETLCAPHGADLCAPLPPDGAKDKRQDLLDYLAGELEGETAAERPADHDVRLRLNCLLFWDSSFVDIVDVGFRECWLAAVATYASSNIALRDP